MLLHFSNRSKCVCCTYEWAMLRDLFRYTVSVKKLFETVSILFSEKHTKFGIPICSSNAIANIAIIH
jgi:hypothetical protein